MNTSLRTTFLGLAAVLGTTLLTTGCDRGDERSAGQKLDAAVAETRREAADARAEASAAMERAGERIDDASITAKVNAALAGDPRLSAMNIDVDSTQGRVSLSGSAPDEGSRQRATELALAVEGVKGVDNQLRVTP